MDARHLRRVTWLGLALALVAPGLLLGARALGWVGDQVLVRILFLEIGLWALVGLLFVLIYRGEGRDARSIGLGRPTWASLGWGWAAAALTVAVCFVGASVLRLEPPSARELGGVGALPLWVRILILVTAAGTEEILCRGYPIPRLQELTGSRPLAASLPLAVFVLYHLPFSAAGHAMFVVVFGAVATGLFLLRRDLWSNIAAHLFVDAPFLLAPMLTGKLAS